MVLFNFRGALVLLSNQSSCATACSQIPSNHLPCNIASFCKATNKCRFKHRSPAAVDENSVDVQQTEQHQDQQQVVQPYPAIWCQGIAAGTFVQEVQQTFPQVTWKPQDLLKVLSYALPAAAVAVGINSQLGRLLIAPTTFLPPSAVEHLAGSSAVATDQLTAAAEAGSTSAASVDQLALLHLSQEAVLALLLPTACRLALGPRVTAAEGSSYWTVQTLSTCLVLFPLVDPLLHSVWQPVAEAVFGPAPVNPLVETLQQAGSSGQYTAVAEHCIASGLLGPFWEEVFWRGFFLTALTKVLPIPACIGLSALNFAALHLSLHNFLPLLVLSATCDCLYLRSGGNLLAPLLLHGLWNTSQVLQIALLQKDTFV